MKFNIRAGARSETGSYRENNEDRYCVEDDGGLYIVADGMGGQLGGEQASQMAVDLLTEKLKELAEDGRDQKQLVAAIRSAVVDANVEIMALAQVDTDCRNMGTTVVLAWQRGDQLFVAGVGDSRAYHIRDGSIEQLTVDHSIAQALVEAETISPEEAREHRFRNVLWKYLGSKELGEGPEVRVIEPQPGDRFLLASDGLTGVLDDATLAKIVSEHDEPQQAADALVQTALDNDTHDNTTCIALYVEPAE